MKGMTKRFYLTMLILLLVCGDAMTQDASHLETATSEDKGDWGLLGLLGLIGLFGLKRKKAEANIRSSDKGY